MFLAPGRGAGELRAKTTVVSVVGVWNENGWLGRWCPSESTGAVQELGGLGVMGVVAESTE